MNQISTTGWIVIILLAGMIIGTNLTLIFALRDRNRKQSYQNPNRTMEILKNPWGAEDREWNKLSEKVKSLPNSKTDEPDQNHKNG